MKKTKKPFDCVEFQHKAGQTIAKETRGMTLQQELAYWQERDRLSKEEWLKARAKRKTA